MSKEVSVFKMNGTIEYKKINNIEELEELNKTHVIHPKALLVHYGHPFNTDLISSKGVTLNTIFPTLALVERYPIGTIGVGWLSRNPSVKQAVALQFDLEESGALKKGSIEEIVGGDNGINYSNHPIGYRPSGSQLEDKKGILLYSLLELGQGELVDKHASFLENIYCPLNTTKLLATHMEELNAILNSTV